MEIDESCLQSQDVCNSIPRGGPIYVPDLVSPLTRTSQFEILIFQELQSLNAELCVDSSQVCEDDLSVDELKILSEEELVDKAFKEAFKGDEDNGNYSHFSDEHSNGVRKNDCRISSHENACLESSEKELSTSASYESLNGSLVEVGNGGRLDKNNSKKRKKRGRIFDRNSRAGELEGNYIAKVEQLAKIKQKQDEDKATARLHSFNGSCKIDEGATPSSEKNERMISLRSITSATKNQLVDAPPCFEEAKLVRNGKNQPGVGQESSLSPRQPRSVVEVKSSSLHQYVPLSYPEVVLCVEVYHNKRTWVKMQEFLVLARQNLTELRDSIYCLTDDVMHKAGQYDPSGYFLIEDVFCNDLRNPSAIDYSKPIFDWLRNSKYEALEKWECIISGDIKQKKKAFLGDVKISHLPYFKAVDMHKTRFCDLEFRLGAGYLYCHQGDCKHVIVIRDMRLIHPEDVQNRAAYPVLAFQMKTRVHKCHACKIYRATKVTMDDKWAQENPCYFCDNCYYLLHYNEDGSLLYHDFTVYDYHPE
ncbi:hypothetical protein HHK36_019811 [Tetracentron sinense]|uniref:snRNA-activating protein complex subunit 3 n=1 Tax=Tetracentron sinense TaxID=13715 RepID=A0A834Z2V2_TETSI|nr:hypothetical protein HHK36_019811 [Tetracentron sinense]